MAEITITGIQTDDLKGIGDFIRLPDTIFRDCPQYVPWFASSVSAFLTRRHPFFLHSEAEFFVAYRNGRPVGRICLIEPVRFNKYQKLRDCRFYFLDFHDDLNIAEALFSHARNWACSRGLNRLIGPQGFSSFTGAGILINGFQERSSMTMMNYHYPYYHELVEQCGFTKYKDFFSAQLIRDEFTMPQQVRQLAAVTAEQNNLLVRSLTSRKELRCIASRIVEIYNAAFVTHEEFSPLTDDELRVLVDELAIISDPNLISVIEDHSSAEKAIVGFLLTFPDISTELIRNRGKSNLLTILRIRRAKRLTRDYLVNGIGILPEYQGRGGSALLFSEIEKTLTRLQCRSAEMTQIAETTEDMISSIEKLGGRIYKTHRIYQQQLPAGD